MWQLKAVASCTKLDLESSSIKSTLISPAGERLMPSHYRPCRISELGKCVTLDLVSFDAV